MTHTEKRRRQLARIAERKAREQMAGVSPGRRRPGEQYYRLSNRAIKRGTILLFVAMAMILLAGIAIGVAGGSAEDYDTQDRLQNVAVATCAAAFLLPVVAAAVLGGLALHRYGWIVGLLFGAGFAVLVYGSTQDRSAMSRWGGGMLVVSVLGFFAIGYIRRVPMWIGGVFGLSRITVSDGELAEESQDRPRGTPGR